MSEWIPISERLPPVGEVCFLCITYPEGTMFNMRADPLKRCNFRLGGMRYNGKFISYDDQYSEEGLKYVSHWMPLPKPPDKLSL